MDFLEKMKEQEKKEKVNTALASIAIVFITALVLKWSWPAILAIFPAIEGSGIVADNIRYWHWFGLVWFVNSIRSLFYKKNKD